MAERIITAVEDQEMRQKAAALGEQIRSEDGIGKAVEVIETYLKED